MENRLLAVGPMEYRRMSDKKLEQEQAYVLHKISLTMQRIQRISVLLCMGQVKEVTFPVDDVTQIYFHPGFLKIGTKLIEDLKFRYLELEAIADEIQYRNIP